MIRLFIALIVTATLFVGCTGIDEKLSERDEQIAKLEELYNTLNADVETLKTLISALQNNDSVVSVTPIVVDGVEIGYKITFTKSPEITIYHGENGKDGEDGANGTNGKDGDSFFSSVSEDGDFVYFTLVDGTVITIPKGKALLNNKIYYTSTNGSKLFPTTSEPTLFGAVLTSNIYKDGQGVMTFDDDITTIGAEVFAGCINLKSIALPNSVKEVGKSAFEGCSNLTEVTFGSGVEKIADSAFHSCINLKNLSVPASLKSIGALAFYNCTSLVRVDIDDLAAWCNIYIAEANSNPLSNGARLYSAGKEVTELTITNEATIKSYTFDGCTSITKAVLSSSVQKIEQCAFYYCTNLKSVTIDSSMTKIEELAFIGCSALASFHSPAASKDARCMLSDGAIVAFAPAQLTRYTIPDGVTKIGNFAFALCNELQEITLCNSMTAIGDQAFFYCDSLRKVAMGDNVTKIGMSAFYGCSSLDTINFSSTLYTIEGSAFYGCHSLASVTIPRTTVSIGAVAFSNCTALSSVYCTSTVPPTISSNTFEGNAASRKIYVPRGSEEIYKISSGWSSYAAHIEPYDL